MEQKPTTIDITPLWVGILPALLAALEDGTDEGQRIAREELKHMAQVADLAKSASEQRDELMAALKEIYTLRQIGQGSTATEYSLTVEHFARAAIDKAEGKRNADNPT